MSGKFYGNPNIKDILHSGVSVEVSRAAEIYHKATKRPKPNQNYNAKKQEYTLSTVFDFGIDGLDVWRKYLCCEPWSRPAESGLAIQL